MFIRYNKTIIKRNIPFLLNIISTILFSVLFYMEKYGHTSTLNILGMNKIRDNVTVPIEFKINDRDIKFIKYVQNIKMTYYCYKDGYTPNTIMNSGRIVVEGAVALSPIFFKEGIEFGDFVFCKETGKWYVVEDKMHPKHTDYMIDIYTHNIDLAKSGLKRTDIVILKLRGNIYD